MTRKLAAAGFRRLAAILGASEKELLKEAWLTRMPLEVRMLFVPQ